ncbi:hypothetical protein F5Y18DRAFT_442863 [Xylariaceae sp. FL1019]|nr:hypothetical protein F5Y18DRAFT_442863 [Xylariaceae sp. FL1019]
MRSGPVTYPTIGWEFLMQFMRRQHIIAHRHHRRAEDDFDHAFRRSFVSHVNVMQSELRRGRVLLHGLMLSLYKAMANEFWPKSLINEDIDKFEPMRNQSSRRVAVNEFLNVNISLLSFRQICEFVSTNARPSFKVPNKPPPANSRRRRRRNSPRRPQKEIPKPAAPKACPRPAIVETSPTPKMESPAPRRILARIPMIEKANPSQAVTPSPPTGPINSTVQLETSKPVLSYRCRAGFDLNDRRVWTAIPGAEFPSEIIFDASENTTFKDSAASSTTPLDHSKFTVSFKATSEKQQQMFLEAFLGRKNSSDA